MEEVYVQARAVSNARKNVEPHPPPLATRASAVRQAGKAASYGGHARAVWAMRWRMSGAARWAARARAADRRRPRPRRNALHVEAGRTGAAIARRLLEIRIFGKDARESCDKI